MSETWAQQSSAEFASEPAVSEALTAGSLLRRAREAAGLHIAALAVSLKVPVRKLEALEEDRWNELSDAVFVRGLASSICRSLKVDPQPVLDRLPQSSAPRLTKLGEGLNTTFHEPHDGAAPRWREQLFKPVFLAVSALLLGALALILLPYIPQDALTLAAAGARPADSPPPGTEPSTVIEPAATNPPSASVAQDAAAQDMPASPEVTGAAAAVMTTAAPAVPVDAAPAAAVTETTGGDRPPATPVDGVIVFRTRSPSWVEVTDAKGVVAVRRVLAAGESAGASGALPLQVVIGRVDATEVQVRGKPFDLRRFSRDNVARFEVK